MVLATVVYSFIPAHIATSGKAYWSRAWFSPDYAHCRKPELFTSLKANESVRAFWPVNPWVGDDD